MVFYDLKASRRRPSLPTDDIERALLLVTQFMDSASSVDLGRMSSLLLSWVRVHGDKVIVEKLAKLASVFEPSPWLSVVAYFGVHSGHVRWRLLAKPVKQKVFPFGAETEELVKIAGVEHWLPKGSALKIPKGSFRIREEDVLSPRELASRNLQYRARLIHGASWRADVLWAIEAGSKTVNEIMEKVGCSYEPAYRILKDYRTVEGLA